MTEQEFIEKAKEYGYDENGIKDLLSGYAELKALIPDASYNDIVLVEQAIY